MSITAIILTLIGVFVVIIGSMLVYGATADEEEVKRIILEPKEKEEVEA
jgi:hypothetical protein